MYGTNSLGPITLVVDLEQSTFLRIASETYQNLIRSAARWVVGLSLGKHSKFTSCFLRSVPVEDTSLKFNVQNPLTLHTAWDRVTPHALLPDIAK